MNFLMWCANKAVDGFQEKRGRTVLNMVLTRYKEQQADGSFVWRDALDLRTKQYSEEELLEHYCELNNWDIIHYQRLSAEFCVRWILDAEEWGVRMPYEEACIVDADVLNRQTHLTEDDLYHAREKLAATKLTPATPPASSSTVCTQNS